MKKYIYIFCLFLFATGLKAQAPNWSWAYGGGGSSGIHQNGGVWMVAITSDIYGNTYAIGNYMIPYFVVGNFTLTNNVPISRDSADVFIVKYNASGQIIWAKSINGSGHEEGTGLILDNAGNIYVTGFFNSSSISFGNKTISKQGGQNMNTCDMFLAKYDAAGNNIWAKAYGGSDDDAGLAVTTDNNSNVYLSATFKSATLTVGTYSMSNDLSSNPDLVISKFDSAGNVLYAKKIANSCTRGFLGQNIGCDINNNLYIAGCYTDASITIGSDNLINRGGEDIFLAKYDPAGLPVWAKTAGGNGFEAVSGLAIDRSGNIVMTGMFDDSLIFGNNYISPPPPMRDVFLAKYNNAGNNLWAKKLNTIGYGNSGTYGSCTAVDIENRIYVGGYFVDVYTNVTPYAVFGTDTLRNSAQKIYSDIFIAQFDSSGISLWGKTSTGSSNRGNIVRGLATDQYSNIYACGLFNSDTLKFGSTILSDLNNNNYFIAADYFIAKLGSTGVGIQNFDKAESAFLVYPNPCEESTAFKVNVPATAKDAYISLADVQGVELARYPLQTGDNSVEVNTANINYNVLFCTLVIDGVKVRTTKMLIMK